MRTLLTFYRNFSLLSVSISLLSCFGILTSGSPYSTIFVFWIKVISNAVFIGYIHFFQSQQFIFFFNLGYSVRQLYVRALALDFTIWIILIILTLQLL